jgi:hypothetical protein
MPLPPYQSSEDDGRSSGFAKGFVVITALGAWALMAFGFVVGSARSGGASGIAELALLLFFGAGALSFIGSAGCLLGVSKKKKKEEPWLRWCAFANYCALATVFGVPMIQSCSSHYR